MWLFLVNNAVKDNEFIGWIILGFKVGLMRYCRYIGTLLVLRDFIYTSGSNDVGGPIGLDTYVSSTCVWKWLEVFKGDIRVGSELKSSKTKGKLLFMTFKSRLAVTKVSYVLTSIKLDD